MKNLNELKCPCGSGKKYLDCCGVFHEGLFPATALELMRSRYAAYAMGLPLYIIRTTHVENPHYKQDQELWSQEIRQFSDTTLFKKLEIVSHVDGPHIAYVTFVATMEQQGRPVKMREKSRFVKEQKQWFYHSGETYFI